MNEYQPQFNQQNSEDNPPQQPYAQQANTPPPVYQAPGVSAYGVPPQYYTYIPYGFTPETYKEKKAIRKAAVPIGVSLLVMTGISLLWATAFYFIMSAFGYDTQTAYSIISDSAVLQVVQIALSTLMFTLPFIIAMRVAGNRISDLVPLGKPKKKTLLPYFLIGIACCAFANIAVSEAGYIFEGFGIDYNVDMGGNPQGFFGFMLSLISTAIVPPLVEEFACRGLIMGSLRRFGDGFAVLTSSIIFALMHGNFEQIPFAFLVGLVLGTIVVKTGSLWASCLVHAFNNFISVFFTYIMADVPSAVQNTAYAFFLIICLLLGITAVLMLKHKGEEYRFERSDTVVAEKKKYKWFFTSPLIIIFAVICVIESCMYFK